MYDHHSNFILHLVWLYKYENISKAIFWNFATMLGRQVVVGGGGQRLRWWVDALVRGDISSHYLEF